jgi:broad-specificity NMP kinase
MPMSQTLEEQLDLLRRAITIDTSEDYAGPIVEAVERIVRTQTSRLKAENKALRLSVIELVNEKQALEGVVARQNYYILECNRARPGLSEVD